MYIFPWFPVDAEFTFGEVSIAPWDDEPDADEEARSTVELIVGLYRLPGDVPSQPSIMWRTGTDRFSVPPEDAEPISQHACQLMLACIAENEYFSGEPITSSHLASYYLQFSPGEPPFGLMMRRRDGHYLNRRRIDDSKITVPLAASVPSDVRADSSFLEALVGCLGSADPLAQRIVESTPFLLMANNLSELTPVLYDVVFLGSAFERLFAIEMPGIAKKFSDHLADLFGSFPQTAAPTWTSFHGTALNGSWLQRWASEFYDYRSSIHPTPPRTNLWDMEMHALLGTVVYCLAVKLLLERAGRYNLSPKDRLELTALDARLAIQPGESPADRWQRALREAIASSGP